MWTVGDRVALVKEQDRLGIVTVVEDNELSVMVRWDDCDGDDFQWSTKLVLIEE